MLPPRTPPNKKKKALIFGVGDFAQVASAYLEDDSEYVVSAFTVHRPYIERTELLGKPVVAFEDATASYPSSEYEMFVAVGYSDVNRNRRRLYDLVRERGYRCLTYISSRSVVMSGATVGEHCFIFENNVVQPFVTIGENVVLWTGNFIGHHSIIEDHVFIATHAVVSGRAIVGESTFVGANATIRDGVRIGASCVVGAGALITRDTEAGRVYKGQRSDAAARMAADLRRI
jgi:sugar O-acyltransferase (sialic acid O-acetyltransferase NeuD family)